MNAASPDALNEIVTALATALSHHALYSKENGAAAASSRDFQRGFSRYLNRTRDAGLFLQVKQGVIHLQDQPLVGATIRGRRLVELVRGNSAGGIVFRHGMVVAEVVALLDLYNESGPPRSFDEAEALLRQTGARSIELVRTDEIPVWFAKRRRRLAAGGADGGRGSDHGDGHGEGYGDGRGDGYGDSVRDASGSSVFRLVETPDAEDVRAAVPLFQDMYQAVEESIGDAASGRAVDVNTARTLGEELQFASQGGLQNVMSLAGNPDYDAYTVGHSIRVALLGVCVASRIDDRAELLAEIGAAGLLHDVGKAQIPFEILYKPAALDPEERKVMAQHACLGAQILVESEDAGAHAIGAAWGHHRRHDRAGYPEGFRWAVQSPATSLLQVCDVFEALTAERPYKPALSPKRAYELMLADRGAFHPAALSAFMRHIGLYPPGICVRLTDGRLARVLGAGDRIDLPCVRMFDDGSYVDLSRCEEEVAVARPITEAEVGLIQRGEEPEPDPDPGEPEEDEPGEDVDDVLGQGDCCAA